MSGRRRPALDLRVAVDGGLGDVAKEPARPVAGTDEGEQLRMVVDEAGGDPPLPECIVAHQPFEEGDVGGDPADPELPERAPHPVDRARARRRPRGDLLQKRVVVPGDDRPRVGGAAVEANAEAGRAPVRGDAAVVGNEAIERVLGGDPALHGMAPKRDGVLRGTGGVRTIPDGASFGHPDLGLHQVHSGDLLGDRVLDLDARVHLDEVETAGVEIVEELHRAGVEVVRLAGDGQRVSGQLVALVRSEAGGRSALDDLLVAPLHRAVPLEEMDDAAAGVGQHLDLQMAGPPDEPLEVDLVLAEGGSRLPPRLAQRRFEPVRGLHHPHAAPAPAPARLEDAGKADRANQAERGLRVRGQRSGRRHGRDAGRLGDGPRGHLVAEAAQGVGAGTDEGDPGRCAGLRKLRRLGEEAVAGVDGVGPGPGRDPHDLVHREIGGDRPQTLPDPVGLVGLGAMQGEAILVGEHRDRGLPHLVGRAQHPDRDLAAIRHQDFREPVHRSVLLLPQGRGRRYTLRGHPSRHRPDRPWVVRLRPSQEYFTLAGARESGVRGRLSICGRQ